MATIDELPFDSAHKFFDALQRSNPEWLDPRAFESPWIFRGVRDAEWEWNLVPSAWRPQFEEDYKWMFEMFKDFVDEAEVDREVGRTSVDLRTQAHREALRHAWIHNAVECTLVESFCGLADGLRFRLPGGESPNFRRKLWYFQFGDHNTEMHPAFGLAQHHRIPTRLLDWTMNPRIAAYFAAENAQPDGGGRIAVFALDKRKINHRRHPFEVFAVPRSDVDYLYAQRGVFTYFKAADGSYFSNCNWPRFDDSDSLLDGGLRKLTLPHAEVPELLRLLWAEEITRAHLMPTLDNVATALKNMWGHHVEGWFTPKTRTP